MYTFVYIKVNGFYEHIWTISKNIRNWKYVRKTRSLDSSNMFVKPVHFDVHFKVNGFYEHIWHIRSLWCTLQSDRVLRTYLNCINTQNDKIYSIFPFTLMYTFGSESIPEWQNMFYFPSHFEVLPKSTNMFYFPVHFDVHFRDISVQLNPAR